MASVFVGPERWHAHYSGATCLLLNNKTALSLSPSISRSGHRSRRRYTTSSCGRSRCGRETSATPLLQNPPRRMVLFMHGPFHIPAMCKKIKNKNRAPETHKLCPNDNRGNAIRGNTFTTNPALSPRWLFAACEPERRG